MTLANRDKPPSEWALLQCDQCGRDTVDTVPELFPDDWCVIVLTTHPAMRRPGGERLRLAVLCPDCNPYRLGPDGSPVQ